MNGHTMEGSNSSPPSASSSSNNITATTGDASAPPIGTKRVVVDDFNEEKEGPGPEKRKRASTKATRASRACRTCRRQKTRCFPAMNTRSCLRCKTLGLECSFLDGLVEEPDPPTTNTTTSTSTASSQPVAAPINSNRSTESRLESLESNVSEILNLLKSNETRLNRVRGLSKREAKETPSFGLPSISFVTSPFNCFGALVSQRNLPPPITRLFNPQMVVHDQDIISLGLLTIDQASYLLAYFRDNYNRWVSFPDNIDIKDLLERIRRRCSLLLTVCCCVSIQFYDRELKTKVYHLLLQKLQTELHQSLLVVPQTIEFMQALAVVSIYSASLSEGDIVIDGWFYSSLALQHFVTKDVLGLVMSFDGVGPVTEFDEITAYRVWNHLCLVHLVCCVMTGRMCILDEARLDLCRRTLELGSASNFDGRMIAEISLQMILYNFIESVQSLNAVEEELKKWKEQWGYLFDQPIIQFTESTYHYGYFLILFHWHYVQNATRLLGTSIGMLGGATSTQIDQTLAACDEKVVKRMQLHLVKVIDSLLIVSDNTYFSHLSDQVHFTGVYAAVMLLKIMTCLATFGRSDEIVDRALYLNKVTSLESKFRQICLSSQDLSAKHADAIAETLALL